MYFFRSIWKNLHLTEFFTRAAPVVPVTNMRNGQIYPNKAKDFEPEKIKVDSQNS